MILSPSICYGLYDNYATGPDGAGELDGGGERDRGGGGAGGKQADDATTAAAATTERTGLVNATDLLRSKMC